VLSSLVVATGLVFGLVMRTPRMFTVIVLTSLGLTAIAALARVYPLGPIRQDLFLVALTYVLIPLVPTAMLSALRWWPTGTGRCCTGSPGARPGP